MFKIIQIVWDNDNYDMYGLGDDSNLYRWSLEKGRWELAKEE